MNKIVLIILVLILITACKSNYAAPKDFAYKEIQTSTFKLASWQKITSSNKPYKFYIEGDGFAFNAKGTPTNNPTPKSITLRELAFNDPSPNIIYLARPCQYVWSDICSKRHWTTARFAPEVINSTAEAIQKTAPNKPVILVGFSGGAQVAGLVATNKPQINVTKLYTIAGNLDHYEWTSYHNVPHLNESMNLADYKNEYNKFPQLHLVGGKDKIIPPSLVKKFINDDSKVIVIPNADHNSGWEAAKQYLYY